MRFWVELFSQQHTSYAGPGVLRDLKTRAVRRSFFGGIQTCSHCGLEGKWKVYNTVHLMVPLNNQFVLSSFDLCGCIERQKHFDKTIFTPKKVKSRAENIEADSKNWVHFFHDRLVPNLHQFAQPCQPVHPRLWKPTTVWRRLNSIQHTIS